MLRLELVLGAREGLGCKRGRGALLVCGSRRASLALGRGSTLARLDLKQITISQHSDGLERRQEEAVEAEHQPLRALPGQ